MQRFRRRTSDANEDDSDWAASDGEGASDEEADGTFNPQYAFWAEKGTWKAKNAKVPRGRGAAVTPALNRHKAHQQVSAQSISGNDQHSVNPYTPQRQDNKLGIHAVVVHTCSIERVRMTFQPYQKCSNWGNSTCQAMTAVSFGINREGVSG